jgi:hypothetical protein
MNAFLLTHKNVYQFICTQHKAPDKSEVYRTLDPQYGTGFKPQLWCIEFGNGSHIFGKVFGLIYIILLG